MAELGFEPVNYASALALTVKAGQEPIPEAFSVKLILDSAGPIAAGEMRADGRDLGVVYHALGETPVELHRFLRHLDTDTTEVWFPTQKALAEHGDDDQYLLYHGHPEENAEPPADPNEVFVPHLDEHTVALYHFEEGEGLAVDDHSGRGHHADAGPEHSPPGWGRGRFGGAMDFGHRSINNYANVADAPDLHIAEGTYETWVRANDLVATQAFLSKDHVGFTTGGHLTMSWIQGLQKLQVRLQSTSAHYFVQNDCDATADRWYHVAFTFGSAGMHLYIDGELEDWNPYTGGTETNDNMLAMGAGTWHYPNPPHEDFLDGMLDGTRISNIQRDFFPYAKVHDDPVVSAEPVALPAVQVSCCGLVACERGTFVYRVKARNPTLAPLELRVRILMGIGVPHPIELYSGPVDDELEIAREVRAPAHLPEECPAFVKIGAGLLNDYGEVVTSDLCEIEFISADPQ